LKSNRNDEIRNGQERYLKKVVSCYGITSKPLIHLFSDYYKDHLSHLDIDTKISLAHELISTKYMEQKEFGIKILGKNVKMLNVKHLPQLETFLAHINDWATCDSFSSKVMGELIKQDSAVGKMIRPWKDSTNLWQQRSGCVSFLKTAKQGKHKETIFKICQTCVKSPERFVQLGNGWVLRELGVHYEDEVVHFIKSNYDSFSREGLRYAIEKMDKDLRSSLLVYGKQKEKKKRKISEIQNQEEKPVRKQRKH